MVNRPIVRLQLPTNPKGVDQRYWEPRKFGPGFSPQGQPQQARNALLLQQLDQEGIVDLGAYLDFLHAENRPPQLVEASFPNFIAAVGVPVLLIPKNDHRMGWRVSNFVGTSTILYSFDAPLPMGLVAAGVTLFAGIPIIASSSDDENNGSVSINDIWVMCNDPNAAYPIPVLGYEATVSLAGNTPP